ncbi:MAG: ATP-binding protein [Cyclobacteriaceae bacterium]|nr:ATP-binding protein [Cyclobacteriaceae bacterium]
MSNTGLVISALNGFSGISLRNGSPLIFRPGINLMVGRNGCGKSNLMQLIHLATTGRGEVKDLVEVQLLVKQIEKCMAPTHQSIEECFGELSIAEFTYKGTASSVSVGLKNVPDRNVVRNLMANPIGFRSSLSTNINLLEPAKVQFVTAGISGHKLELTSYVLNNSFINREMNNKYHAALTGPAEVVSTFIRARLIEFFTSDEFNAELQRFRNAINDRFSKFLNTTRKEIKIEFSVQDSGRVAVVLMDNGNHIETKDLSTGELLLLDLIFSLRQVSEENSDILCLDEPDIHMHEDMIQVLVDELHELSKTVPECVMIIASHSTAFIERLAKLGADTVNIISFDKDRGVSNSVKDLELINALQRNGVSFSPLMLTRRLNIFIENRFKPNDDNKDLLLQFFDQDQQPNIIPIGFSGNVADSDTFASIFESLLNVSDIPSVGIQDGDRWFKNYLVGYLSGKLSLDEFVQTLLAQQGGYIHDAENSKSLYFNFWEIENLRFMPEMLSCWTQGGVALTAARYRGLLEENITAIHTAYVRTFAKSITSLRIPDGKKNMKVIREFLNDKTTAMHQLMLDDSTIDKRMDDLISHLLEPNLQHWLPGKEIMQILKGSSYQFNLDGMDCRKTTLAKSVTQIPGLSKYV